MIGRLHHAWLAFAAVLAAGCPTVDLGDSPPPVGNCRPDPTYYQQVIWPEFLADPDEDRNCVGQAGCHRRDDGRSSFQVNTSEPIDHDSNYAVVTRFLNCGSPDSSALLTKPLSGRDPHGGGDLFGDNDAVVSTFLMWFDQ